MKLGFIGLGKMGGNMVARLITAKHDVVVFDPNQAAVDAVVSLGAKPAKDLKDLIAQVETKVFWLMIPASAVDDELKWLLKVVQPGSIIVDGGNSDYRLTIKRAKTCLKKGVHLVDVGTSGGILGRTQGYAMMIGGDETAAKSVFPIVESLAPKDGWHYFGPSGSGHYVKMVHNAIEYGAMEAYAEGYRMLKDGPVKGINLAAAGDVWQHGSIIASLLNALVVQVLQINPELKGVDGFVRESGEARWTVETAKKHDIELPIIKASLNIRLKSQKGKTNFGTKLLAEMRNKFGGHAINKDR